MKPTPEEIEEAKKNTSHQDLARKTDGYSPRYLVAIEAVKACQRPHGPPLLWFRSDYEFVNDGKDSSRSG